MIATDEEALICDLAETYNIYNMRSFSPLEIATFSVGLRENSRIKLKLSGQTVPLETVLLACVVDRLSLLLWSKSKDATKNINRPASILETLTQTRQEPERDYEVFNTPEEFEQAMKRLNERG